MASVSGKTLHDVFYVVVAVMFCMKLEVHSLEMMNEDFGDRGSVLLAAPSRPTSLVVMLHGMSSHMFYLSWLL